MKAWVCAELNGIDALQFQQLAQPEPAPGEVLVDIKACGLNFADILKTCGQYQAKIDLPFVLGSEFCGVCTATGQGVDNIKPGDRVAGMGLTGAFAEQISFPENQLVLLPQAMNFEVAAGFYSNYLTAYYGLVQRGSLQPNETLVVLAAGGGTGLAAVDIGAALGARVIAVAGSDEKLELAQQRGASETLNYRNTDIGGSLKELTQNRGVDVIFDPVGGDMFDNCIRRMAWNGRYLVVGFASGRIPKLAANLCLVKGFSLIGVFGGGYLEREPQAVKQTYTEMHTLYNSGKLNPNIHVSGSLRDLPETLKLLKSGNSLGKLVLTT